MIRIETLGRTRVFADNREIKALPSQPIRCALLVYLALERAATRDKLLGMFWPEQDEKNARHALNQNMYELRKTLGDRWLETQGDQLSIAVPVQLDVNIFEEAVARGDHRVALEVYRGPFLGKGPVVNARGFEEWVDQRCFKLRRTWIRSAQTYVEQLVAAGSFQDAIHIARQVVEAEPQEDQLQHLLIDLLHRAGRRKEALEQYELYEKALLEDELEPLDETKQLIEDIRASGGAVAIRSPTAMVVTSPVAVETRHVEVAEPVPVAAVPLPESKPSLWRRKETIAAASGVALMVIVGAALIIDTGDSATRVASPNVAVLYLDVPSNDTRVRQFADELSDELANVIMPLRGANQIPRSEIVQVRDRRISVDSAAARLNADLLVSGNVNLTGDRLRLRLELIDGKRNTVIGKTRTVEATWPMDSTKRLAVLTDAAIAMRTELGREITLRQRHAGTQSVEAWALYLRADSLRDNAVPLIHTGGRPAAISSLSRADSLLRRAEAIDTRWLAPTLLRSTIAEFRGFLLMGFAGQPEQARLWYDTALTHATRAASKHPADLNAVEQRGLMRLRFWEMLGPAALEQSAQLVAAAEADLQQVVAADAERGVSWLALSKLHHTRADFENEKKALLNARRYDNYSAQLHDILYRLSFASFELGEDQEAIDYCREGQRRFSEELSFLYCEIALLAWADSIPADTVRAFELVRKLENSTTAVQEHLPEQFRMLAATVLLRAGNQANALARIDQLSKQSKYPWTARLEAIARARAGQLDQAIPLLRTYAPSLPVNSISDLRSRTLKPLHGLESFQALLRQYSPPYIDR
jgi:DNA-binding SARP family transcriptional activator/TolB-like protein